MKTIIKAWLTRTYALRQYENIKPMVEIEYPEKTKLLSVFSIYENLDKIEFFNDEETAEDFFI